MAADPSVELTTGEALGWSFPLHYHHGLKHPAAVVNNFGQGKALLFNFAIYPAPFDGFLQQTLAALGVKPAIDVKKLAGAADTRAVARLLDEGEQVAPGTGGGPQSVGVFPQGVELTRWKKGDTELISLLGDYATELEVNLPEPRHVYNIKTKEALGMVSSFKVQLQKSRASFFALLPAAAESPAIDLSTVEATRGTVVRPTLTIAGATGPRALKLAISPKDGNKADWVADHVVLEEGRGTVTIPFALNDPTGAWSLRVEDIFTGKSATQTIALQ